MRTYEQQRSNSQLGVVQAALGYPRREDKPFPRRRRISDGPAVGVRLQHLRQRLKSLSPLLEGKGSAKVVKVASVAADTSIPGR